MKFSGPNQRLESERKNAGKEEGGWREEEEVRMWGIGTLGLPGAWMPLCLRQPVSLTNTTTANVPWLLSATIFPTEN